ncbi:MAG: threonylcarbamoyl-AMP synthase [Oscillospiraceae bacterium]|nr:threonylcarbamoyl-AMP synthase [Oscillospiraceae bacterium]
MKTVIITDPREAAHILRRGGLLAVPTETVYGLAANGLDAAAVEEIYEVKGRPAVKPLSLMLPGPEATAQYAGEVPEAAKALAEAFWPGPLTLVLKAKDTIPDVVRAGGDTIGLRCPDHPLTLELLREIGFPLAAPSANPSGLPSPKSAEEVLSYFDGRIDGVLDGGPCGLGTESTILDLSKKPYRILRRGALPEEAVADALVERMTVFGITGGSGSGKTTALRVLRGLGALVIDADAVYHGLLRSDESLMNAISARFPGTVREHTLDRKALAAAVFSDPEALSDLNAITHPAVITETKRRLREHAMAGGELAAIDAIALLGSGLEKLCDRTYAVVADREARVSRIMARDGISREAALRRIEAQRPDDYFIENCSAVLHNDSSESAFESLCKTIFKEDLTWTN